MGQARQWNSKKPKRSGKQSVNLFGGSNLAYKKHAPLPPAHPPSPRRSKRSHKTSIDISTDVEEDMDIDINDNTAELAESRTRAEYYKKQTRNEHRRAERAKQAKKAMQADYDELYDTSIELEEQNSALEEQNTQLTLRNTELEDENRSLMRLVDVLKKDLLQVRCDLVDVHKIYQQELESLRKTGADTDALSNLYAAQLEKTLARNKELEQEVKRLWVRSYRAPGQKQLAVDRAVEKVMKVNSGQEAFRLKEKGMVPENTRAMIRELVGLGISVTHIAGAISAVARALGVKIEGTLSARTVSRIVLEGGVAAQMQLVYEAHKAKYLTISGDGTSDRHINYESKFMTLTVDNYDGTGLSKVPASRFMGICSALNHMSATQFAGWVETVKKMYEIYNNSPSGKTSPLEPRQFAIFITGLNTDHAEDQKKLARLIRIWKRTCNRRMRGHFFLEALAPDELTAILCAETERKIAEAGGSDEWDALSVDEQRRLNQEMYENTCICYGEEAFEALLPEEQLEVDFFIWGGCCMHKEMNSVKGGAARMAASWKAAGIPGPILLMNRDNTAIAALGPSAAKDRAEEISQGGGIKAASLGGALFHHKDRKKGHQDALQNFMEQELGYQVQRFPDTSNIRYQSFCSASAEFILHGDKHIKFLDQVRAKKGSLNNMEANLYAALNDDPTRTESAVLAIYEQLISIPYMLQVRGDDDTNLLDLGPLHDAVKAQLQKLIHDSDEVLGPNASPENGTLDGKTWQRPEIFYAVQRLQGQNRLPNLRGAFVAFCEGALDTWERFTSEFRPGGDIDKATPEQRRRAFMHPTNDPNEGSLGGFRGGRTKSPTITLHQWNARTMHKRNNTHRWMLWVLTPDDYKYIRATSRMIDSSGIAAAERIAQAKHQEETSVANEAKSAALKAKHNAASAAIDIVEVVLDIDHLRSTLGRMRVGDLDSQLDWHRRYTDWNIPVKSKLGNKQAKFNRLTLAIQLYWTPSIAAEPIGRSRKKAGPIETKDVEMPLTSDVPTQIRASTEEMEDEFDPGYH